MKIGMIGIGIMGFAMSQKLMQAGHQVYGRDLNADMEKRATESGITVLASPADVAAEGEIVILSLPLPADVRGVVEGPSGLLNTITKNQVIADTSTIDPFTTQDLAAKVIAKGAGYLDTPILGRPHRCGHWTLPIGGDKKSLEKATPVLECIASRLIHVGPAGYGHILKLLNNLMFGAINTATAEMFAIGSKLGINPKVLYDAIAESGAATVSNLFIELGKKVVERDFSPAFAIDYLHKDMGLGIEMAHKSGVPSICFRDCQQLNELAKSLGFGNEDTSAGIKVYEEILGIKIQA
jgi:3-hydroxyisobutyrate dehydrogenase-like beta-hydroxyacid dehydrogenase